ncbi:ferredoxin--nitrite reductase [Synechococcus elongatus]|uniref:Ferredoxin--nitrite reductase n=1 Tax=Synechococcus elongatus PCC 11801 TaxID=2219813 RepID=A0AAN1UV16_SYNEL|nr:ferredoxin--nitrite reductase [Synechococcus elongatus]AZB73165.1 ferredoxin--nitrite reductase [Synechococcus elongatus PCC 11801]
MAQATVTTEKLNKFEKIKLEKDGLAVRDQVEHFASIGWEAMDPSDREHRLKWLGIFWRPVTPGRFMARLRVPHGILQSRQLNALANFLQRYGDQASVDITTRQNLQLRGLLLEDTPAFLERLQSVGLTSVQSGMDNVRNITGSPVAGLDADELFDTRSLIQDLQDNLTALGQGNPEFTNLPRKFNIAIEGGRDNSIHAEINDLAFTPAYHNGVLGFNVWVGGFFSSTRVAPAIPLNAWVPADQSVIQLSRAILEVFRDHGSRGNRQKTRLMWLIDEWGIDHFRQVVCEVYGSPLSEAAPEAMDWEKRDFLGVHPQKQTGLNYVGLHVPVGRLKTEDLYELARLADTYGQGEVRLTVEQNVILTHISDAQLPALLAEPLLARFSPQPAPLSRGTVSCTGSQYCNFALIETKQRAIAIAQALEAELDLPRPVRIHWTGCPNSCGQPQVADIGLMGAKVRKDGQVVEGVDIFLGGQVGHAAHLGEKALTGIACEDLPDVLRQLLIERFGAQARSR